MINRPDWGPPPAGNGGRETPGDAVVPAATEPTAEDQAQVAGDDDVDDEEAAADRKLLADGIFTREELARMRGRPVEEIGKSPAKPVTRQAVDQELAAISKRMKEDRRGYFKDEAAQARHLELIELRSKLQAEPAKSDARVAPGDLNRQAIDKELDEIAKHRRENRVAYFRDDKMRARELKLLEARAVAKERAGELERAQATVDSIVEAVPDAEAFEDGFDSVFAGLAEPAQAAIRHEFALPPESPARPASEADVKRFASTEEGAELVKTWGKDAGRKVAVVRTRLDRMLTGGGEMEAAARWFDSLQSGEAKAVLLALAG